MTEFTQLVAMMVSHSVSHFSILDCFDLGSSPIKHVESYDPIANCWTQVSPLSRARSGLSVVTLRELKDVKELSYYGNNDDPHENGSDLEDDDNHQNNVVVLDDN